MLTHPYTLTRHQWRVLFSQARTLAKLANGSMPRYRAMDIALEMAYEWGAIPSMTAHCGECPHNGWSISLGDAMYRTPRYTPSLQHRLERYKADKRRQEPLSAQIVSVRFMGLEESLNTLCHEVD